MTSGLICNFCAKLKLWKSLAARKKYAKQRGGGDNDKEKREHDYKHPTAHAARACADAAVHVLLNFL